MSSAMINDLPEYSLEGRFVLDTFHLEYVTAFFYFEDAEHESVYERLLHRIFPKIKKFQVICLGGKTKVLEKAREPRERDKKSIFVLDKDYDDLLGHVEVLPDVYYLHKYSIENYFSDVASLLHVVVDEMPREGTYGERATQLGDISAYVQELERRLIRVSRLFVVARKFRVSIPTSKISVEEMIEGCDEINPMPTDEWIAAYKERLKASTEAANDWLADNAALDPQLGDAFTRVKPCPLPALTDVDQICGKHLIGCLVRLVDIRLKANLCKLGVVELYIRLVNHLNTARFNFFAEALHRDHPSLFYT